MRNLFALLYFCWNNIALAQQQPKLILPVGHSEPINYAEFSPDGKQILTASSDNTTKVWDVATGKLIHSLDGHSDEVKLAKFSPDGKLIVSVSDDGTSKLWELITGRLVATLTGHSRGVRDVSFSPATPQDPSGGKYIVTGSADNTLRVWEAKSGKSVFILQGHTDYINTVKYSSNGRLILSGSDDGTVKLWDSGTGKLMRTFDGKSKAIKSAIFSSNAKLIIATSDDGPTQIWNTETGKLIHSIRSDKWMLGAWFSNDLQTFIVDTMDSLYTRKTKFFNTTSGKVQFVINGFNPVLSPNEKTIATQNNGKLIIWDIASQKQQQTFNTEYDGTIQFSPKCPNDPNGGFYLLETCNKFARLLEVSTGKVVHNFEGKAEDIIDGNFSPASKGDSVGGQFIVTDPFYGNSIKVWNGKTGTVLHSLKSNEETAYSTDFTPDIKHVISAYRDGIVKLWNLESGKLERSIAIDTTVDDIRVQSGHISPSTKNYPTGGQFIYVPYYDGFSFNRITKFWETTTGKFSHRIIGNNTVYSSGGKYVAATEDFIARIWDQQTWQEIQTLEGHTNEIEFIQFSPDEKHLLTASQDKTVRIWEIGTGKLIRILNGHTDQVNMAQYSPNGKLIISGSSDKTVKLWDSATGSLLRTLEGHSESIQFVSFNAGGDRFASSSVDGALVVWEASTGKVISTIVGRLLDIRDDGTKILASHNNRLFIYEFNTAQEILSWISMDSTDWVVTHPSGLFDASPGAMTKLHFVQGLDIIDFNQLKERYYEPGLWKKIMAGEPLRNVVGMKSIDLPPDIQVGQVDNEGFLQITLTNRGGGIGEVNIFLNGKEIIKDAREGNAKSDASMLALKVFVGKHKNMVKGQENLIAVKAWNKDHWVQSRGQIVSYHSKEIESYKPAVYILTCGVSDYTGNEIDLKYAAKDANDVSVALQLGAKKLFGAERSYVYNLTTTQAKESYPTKTNILKTFEKITSTAHPLDIFVMYVSGHGINYGGQDGDWHYLTQEAYTGSGAAYNDPAIRAQTTISSNELVELFKKVPALKQVLMLDACASGKVVDNLIAQKDIESSTLRALDRMRDRTGMHIITGCTADAVSYEASKYGQGVLTYSLLEGIRGAALREDQYVDVNKLFQYAQDRVPQLAEGIGGIQSPQVFSPQGSQSFDIGLLSDVEKKEIPIAKIRPVYIRSNFQDENEMEDVLGIGKAVDASLNEASAKGIEAQLIFVDVREYPDACKLIGRYRKEGSQILLKLRKKCGSEDKTFDLKASDVYGLKAEVLKVL